jgi:hypothetical protein
MLYIVGGLLLLALLGTGGGYVKGRNDGVDLYKAQLELAEQQVREQQAQLEDEAIKKQSEMVTAFDKGKSEGLANAKIVYVKGAQYVANDKALSNPVCRMDDASLRFLQSARADVRTAAASAEPAAGLPGPGSVERPVVRSAVPAVDPGRGAVPGVPQQPAQPSSTGQVPGQRVPSHPKPTPIK